MDSDKGSDDCTLVRLPLRVVLGLHRDNEKENGNDCLGFRV